MAEDVGHRTRPGAARASVLVRERLQELAQLEARNVGKPISDARDEIGIVADTLEYWGGAANKIFGETVPVQDPGSTSPCANRWGCARSSRRGTSRS